MFGWLYQEMWFEWLCWSFGYRYADGHGWELDQLTLHFGPLAWCFLREKNSA